jgi:thiamine-phosphate pyrophosphorylase
MNWKKRVFDNFRLYAITDLREEDPGIFKKVEAAYRGGADIVQLRSKTLPDGALYRVGVRLRSIADRHRKLFFVNDRPDLALAVGADGIHVGQDDLPPRVVRRLFGRKPMWLGLSTHSLSQALQAVKEPVDYIGVGPIFETPTKPAYRRVGLDLIRKVKGRLPIPFVCIGGIDSSNVKRVLGAGAERIAVVRAVFGARNVYQATRNLREAVENYGR